MNHDITLLPLADATPADGGGGCGCGCGDHADATASPPTRTPEETPMTSQTFAVVGMTCGHCVHAVTEEIKALPGVSDVFVELVNGGTSTVTVIANPPLATANVAGALEEAGGYTLAAS
jgi:copper chaperone CopZ